MSRIGMIPEKITSKYVLVKIPLNLWEEIDELVELNKFDTMSLNDIVEKSIREFVDRHKIKP